jgi:hypothetical protein
MDQLAEDDYVGEDICYLDDSHALLTSAKGRLFVVDVVRLKVLEEASRRLPEWRSATLFSERTRAGAKAAQRWGGVK